jgi:hypothetical protein
MRISTLLHYKWLREPRVLAILPADQAYAHESGKKRFNEAITRLIANGDLWELHDDLFSLINKGQVEQTDEALEIELTRERFGNLVAFRIGKSPRRFWCWESALRVDALKVSGSRRGNSLIRLY